MIRFFCIIVQPSIQLSILELDKAEMLIKVAVNGLSEKCISYASIFCLLQLKACVYHLVQSSHIHTGAKLIGVGLNVDLYWVNVATF